VLTVLPVARIVTSIAIAYAVFLALFGSLFWWWTGGRQDALTIAGWAMTGSTFLNLVILYFLSIGWRKIWRKVPWLSENVFPDLTGEWDFELSYHGDFGEGTAFGRATIKQSLLKISIQVQTGKSLSHTLSVTAQMDAEAQAPLLQYLYRVNPEPVLGPAGMPYRGAAILHYVKDDDLLRGKYWTERPTFGEYVLRRAESRSIF